jgi:hypothetical protein
MGTWAASFRSVPCFGMNRDGHDASQPVRCVKSRPVGWIRRVGALPVISKIETKSPTPARGLKSRDVWAHSPHMHLYYIAFALSRAKGALYPLSMSSV